MRLLPVFVFLPFVFLRAQPDTSFSAGSMELPSSPAFILFDQSPTVIERPGNGKAFMMSILNTLGDNGGLPSNYAMEITPFWYFKHPRLNALKYMGYDKAGNRQLPFHGMRMTSLSAAYVQTQDSSGAGPRDNFSFGLRSRLFTVKSKRDLEDIRKANKAVIEVLRKMNREIAGISINKPELLETGRREDYNREVTRIVKQYEGDSVFVHSPFPEILSRRPVFSIDLAAAYGSFFTSGSYSSGRFSRAGAWLTMSYSAPFKSGSGNYLSLYAMGRYLYDGNAQVLGDFIEQRLLDGGFKAELALGKLSLAYEYLYRSSDLGTTYRSNGSISYRVSDQLILNGAFGKNFGHENNLITFMGISWGLSSGNERVAGSGI